MKPWQDEQLQLLLAEDNEHQVFDHIAEIARRLGFDHCAYGVRPPLPVSRQRIVMFNTYPTEWRERYAKQNYLAVDPTVQHGLRSALPVVWSEEFFANAREFWEEARAFNLRYGWAHPCRDAQGVLGMLTVAEMQETSIKLSWLAQISHLAMTRILVRKLVPESNVKLSHQETAVIRWTADGKSAAEIAKIMGLSVRTVTFHLTNVTSKLNAANKTAAAVRAAMLGLLY